MLKLLKSWRRLPFICLRIILSLVLHVLHLVKLTHIEKLKLGLVLHLVKLTQIETLKCGLRMKVRGRWILQGLGRSTAIIVLT